MSNNIAHFKYMPNKENLLFYISTKFPFNKIEIKTTIICILLTAYLFFFYDFNIELLIFSG